MSGYWLSQVPSGWHLLPLRRVTELQNIRINGTSRDEGYIGLENIEPWTGRLLKSDVVYLEDDDEKSGVVASFDAGDVLFGKLRPYLAKAHLAQENGICTTELLVLKPQKQMDARFLLRIILTNEFINQVNTETFGARMPRADWNIIGNLLVPVPPLPQQRAIADYLDRETARIDALIAAKERLLELLAEKRRAVITHAVTRGLNPDVSMRDSGVEWLGEVPSHWGAVGFTKYLKSWIDYRGHTPEKTTAGVFLVTARNIRNGKIDYELSKEYVGIDDYENVMSRGKPKVGDLLLTMEAPLGQTALIDREDVALAQRVIKLNFDSQVLLNEFVMYWIMSEAFQSHIYSWATGSTALGIKASKLSELINVVPPIQEQVVIIEYIRQQEKQISTLFNAIEKTIALLRERRAALIAAAVSGQIQI